jgi:hypothetical protein
MAWLLPALLHSRAYAFQNPARFVEDAADSGGGSQRFFTGSRADAYTCKVCHAPEQAAHVDVIGLPLRGYVPGMTYAFSVDWPDDLKAVGLNPEITDESGLAAGELSVPPVAQLTAADLCSSGGQSGAGVFPMDKRSVAVVGECGQHQATLVWLVVTEAKAPARAPANARAEASHGSARARTFGQARGRKWTKLEEHGAALRPRATAAVTTLHRALYRVL